MPAPTQSSPAYRKRLIDAMLHEPALRDMACPQPGYTVILSPKYLSWVAGLALLSAMSVFLFLCHRDRSANASGSPVLLTHAKSIASPASEGQATDRETVTRTMSSPPAQSQNSGPLEFRLKRSRTFEKVGSIGVRLLRVNSRRRTCDLLIQLDDRRTIQRRLQLNKPLQIKQESSADSLQILVSSISRNSVAGVIANPSASSIEINRQ